MCKKMYSMFKPNIKHLCSYFNTLMIIMILTLMSQCGSINNKDKKLSNGLAQSLIQKYFHKQFIPRQNQQLFESLYSSNRQSMSDQLIIRVQLRKNHIGYEYSLDRSKSIILKQHISRIRIYEQDISVMKQNSLQFILSQNVNEQLLAALQGNQLFIIIKYFIPIVKQVQINKQQQEQSLVYQELLNNLYSQQQLVQQSQVKQQKKQQQFVKGNKQQYIQWQYIQQQILIDSQIIGVKKQWINSRKQGLLDIIFVRDININNNNNLQQTKILSNVQIYVFNMNNQLPFISNNKNSIKMNYINRVIQNNIKELKKNNINNNNNDELNQDNNNISYNISNNINLNISINNYSQFIINNNITHINITKNITTNNNKINKNNKISDRKLYKTISQQTLKLYNSQYSDNISYYYAINITKNINTNEQRNYIDMKQIYNNKQKQYHIKFSLKLGSSLYPLIMNKIINCYSQNNNIINQQYNQLFQLLNMNRNNQQHSSKCIKYVNKAFIQKSSFMIYSIIIQAVKSHWISILFMVIIFIGLDLQLNNRRGTSLYSIIIQLWIFIILWINNFFFIQHNSTFKTFIFTILILYTLLKLLKQNNLVFLPAFPYLYRNSNWQKSKFMLYDVQVIKSFRLIFGVIFFIGIFAPVILHFFNSQKYLIYKMSVFKYIFIRLVVLVKQYGLFMPLFIQCLLNKKLSSCNSMSKKMLLFGLLMVLDGSNILTSQSWFEFIFNIKQEFCIGMMMIQKVIYPDQIKDFKDKSCKSR